MLITEGVRSPRTMAMHYTIEIEIDQPREKVAELFGNPENLGFWQPGFRSIEHLSGESGKPGEKFRLLYDHGRRGQVEMIETVHTNSLPECYFSTYVADGMEIKVENRFEVTGASRTRWVSDNTASVSGVMMRLMTIFMPGCFRKESFSFMENFKAFAESGADVRDASADST